LSSTKILLQNAIEVKYWPELRSEIDLKIKKMAIALTPPHPKTHGSIRHHHLAGSEHPRGWESATTQMATAFAPDGQFPLDFCPQ